jgi:multidrug efflux pump subunit AcrA (membrane-fusion protein)
MSAEQDDQERPCLHCMMVELLDDFFAEYPAAGGEPDAIDTDEVVTAIAKTVAELTCGICLLIPERTMGQAAPPLTAPGRTQNTIGMMSIGTAASRVVKEVLVHEGSRVHAGQIIVTLSCGPLEAEARARDAQLRAAGPRPEEIAVGEAVVGYSQAPNSA